MAMRLRDYRLVVVRPERTRSKPADLLRNSAASGIVRCQSGSPSFFGFLGFLRAIVS